MPFVTEQAGRLHGHKLEYNLADHCNLSCRECSHLSPYIRKYFASIESFERDLSRLAEVLFIEVLRRYVHQHEGHAGWLAGLGDRVVGKALNALHQQPCREWTLADLARVAGTSRSVLAERFQHLVGTSPMQYLTQWRMLMAANLLRRSNAPLSWVAEEVGYQNDTSFIRAFRREYGQPPAACRRNNLADAGQAVHA